MWRYRHILIRLLKRNHLYGSTRAKHDQDSSVLLHNGLYQSVGNQDPSNVSSHCFGNSYQQDTSRSSNSSVQTFQQLKSFDKFGLLSSWDVDYTSAGTHDTASRKDTNYNDATIFDLSVIPSSADFLELDSLMECCDVEKADKLLHQEFYLPDVFCDEAAIDFTSLHDFKPGSTSHRKRSKSALISESVENYGLDDPSSSSSPRTRFTTRFDPDDNRPCRASPEEIISAVHSQDISSLRLILSEKKWPDCRSIGAHLDHLFELVIRDSRDVDEALLFLRDFAMCNRRGFLHDLNGIRLASRVVRETGSLSATMQILRVFRNMFLVRSPKATCSIPECILEELYTISCSVGSRTEVEKLHKLMISNAFVENSDIFIRVYIENLLLKDDFVNVFIEWKRLSSRYGTTCASDLIWRGIFTLVSNRAKRVNFAGDLLTHCNQYDHPAAIIANLLIVLIQIRRLDAARAIFLKVSVPGRFFKKPLLRIASHKNALNIIENFALLVTECMFAEKRRPEYLAACEQASMSILSEELLTKLNHFYGMGRSKLRKLNKKNEKLKFYSINEEQLLELSEFIQLIWMQKAESNNDIHAINRLVSWSTTNRLEIPSKIKQRIELIKGNFRT